MSDDLAVLRDKARRLVDDLPYFAEYCLKIRPKAGGMVQLILARPVGNARSKRTSMRTSTG